MHKRQWQVYRTDTTEIELMNQILRQQIEKIVQLTDAEFDYVLCSFCDKEI